MSSNPDLYDGYAPRQLADIQIETNEKIAEIINPVSGEKPFQNDTDDTIAQQFVAIVSEQTAKVENIAKVAYDMRDPLSAVGVALSGLVQLNAITRKAGSSSIISLEIKGKPNTLIPVNSKVSSEDDSAQFVITENIVIHSSGIVTATAKCTAMGEVNPLANTVTVMSTPISGWESVTNTKTISVGTDEETDAELRRRQQQSTNNTAYRHIEAIRAAVLNVQGVTFCRAYQNSTLTTDERGIPGKDVAIVAVGGDDREIAYAMFHEFGISQVGYGNVTEVFFDDQNIGYPISFSRPIERLVYIEVSLQIIVDEKIQIFPSNGAELVKKAIVEFSQYGSNLCEPLGNTGFPPGQNIIRSYLYTPINSIGGARIMSIKLGLDGDLLTEQDIDIKWNEIGLISEDRIEVVFV